jgi:drug/metabolite transporter (DMT)-like permease
MRLGVPTAQLLAVGAMLLFVLEAAFVKAIGPEVNAAQVALVRAVAQFVFLALWLRGRTFGMFATARPGMHVLRGLFSATGSLAYFYVFALLPMATATVVFFSSVLFTTMAAGPVLGEKVGWRRWSATLAGFAGILIVVRPGTVTLDWPLLVAFYLAINSSAITLSTKDLTRTEPTETIMAWIGATTLAFCLPIALVTWTWPTVEATVLMVLVAITGTLGQWASVSAFRLADASGIAPIQYLRIVFAGAIGWWLFEERIDGWSILGAAIVTGSAFYITIREAQLKRDRAGRQPDV